MVIIAQTTGRRAAFGRSSILGIFNAGSYLAKAVEPVIYCRIRPIEIIEFSVLRARAMEHDLVVFFHNFRINDGIACGAKTVSFFYQH
jgi:hypothetical protein